MLKYLLLGGGLAFASAVQPGPLQAYLFAQATARGWRRTLPAALSPLLSDGPIAFLALFVLGRLTGPMQYGLRLAGGVLLLYLASAAFRQWRRFPESAPKEDGATPRTLLQAAFVNLLNPHPYLGWSLVLGPTAVAAWEQGPSHAVVYVAAFYGVMVTTLGATIVLFGNAQRLGPRGQRALLLVSVATLAGIGVYQLAYSLPRLLGS